MSSILVLTVRFFTPSPRHHCILYSDDRAFIELPVHFTPIEILSSYIARLLQFNQSLSVSAPFVFWLAKVIHIPRWHGCVDWILCLFCMLCESSLNQSAQMDAITRASIILTLCIFVILKTAVIWNPHFSNDVFECKPLWWCLQATSFLDRTESCWKCIRIDHCIRRLQVWSWVILDDAEDQKFLAAAIILGKLIRYITIWRCILDQGIWWSVIIHRLCRHGSWRWRWSDDQVFETLMVDQWLHVVPHSASYLTRCCQTMIHMVLLRCLQPLGHIVVLPCCLDLILDMNSHNVCCRWIALPRLSVMRSEHSESTMCALLAILWLL